MIEIKNSKLKIQNYNSKLKSILNNFNLNFLRFDFKKCRRKVCNGFLNSWHYLVVLILAVVFFVATSSLNFLTQSYGNPDFVKFASPDETANYTFAKHYAQTGEITITEEDNLIAADIIHPRSVRSDFGTLKPVSFLGIILIYGKIAALTSYKVIPFLTPLFAAIGLFYFYALVKKLFGKNNALICAFLLASFPPYIYYSMRSMFHNVLFTVLLVIGLYYAVAMVKKKVKKIKAEEQLWWWVTKANWHGLTCAMLSGVFIGLAISVRTSELIWLAPLVVLLWLFNIKKAGVVKPILLVLFAILALLPTFYYNQLLFDSFYLGGYAEMNKSIINIKEASVSVVQGSLMDSFSFDKNFWQTIKNNILVFGLHPRQAAFMFKYYFIDMFWWLFWPALFGFLIYFGNWKRWRYRHFVYFLCLAVISAILILYYGSWIFYDNPNRGNHTIGNSYTRYWLPIYLGILPLVSLLIMRLSRIISWPLKRLHHRRTTPSKFFSFRFSRKFFYNGLRIMATLTIFFWSINFLLHGSEEGLVYLVQTQRDAKGEWQEVLNLTEDNSAIITTYHDKLFFPERKVIMGLFNDENMNSEYANLVNRIPVYYYNFAFKQEDLDYLNNTRLAGVELQIEEVRKMNDKFALYRIYKKETENKKIK